MPLHPLRARLREGSIIATTIAIPSATVVEALGASPFDALLIDAEHSPLSIDRLEHMLRAGDVAGAPTLVRVPESGPYIPRVLDLGAAGIVVPRVETAGQARDAVDRVRYAPDGKRGAGVARGQTYGATLGDYVARANDSILLAVQIETAAGLEAADEILAVPGIDAVVIGPFDLATSLGTTVGSAEHRAAVDRVFEAADRHDVAKGTFSFSVEDAADHLARGARLVFLGLDLGFLVEGASAAWHELALAHDVEGVAR